MVGWIFVVSVMASGTYMYTAYFEDRKVRRHQLVSEVY